MLDTRGDEWAVFRPRFDCPHTVGLTVSCVALSCLWSASALLFLNDGSTFASVSPLLIISVALLAGVLFSWTYFVAIDERYLTVGRVRRSSDETIERRAIASVLWRRSGKQPHAALFTADGRPLLELHAQISKRQAARIAEHLGVPFVPHVE